MKSLFVESMAALIAFLGLSCETYASGEHHVNVPGDQKAAYQQLFAPDIKDATASFVRAMKDSESFELLANFMHMHSERYAVLMRAYEKERRDGNSFGEANYFANIGGGYTNYLHRKTAESREFAAQSAAAWKRGWGVSPKEVVLKLHTENFPSTRRIAIEFLKRENNDDDFGFVWNEGPASARNSVAIVKWKLWLKQRGDEPVTRSNTDSAEAVRLEPNSEQVPRPKDE